MQEDERRAVAERVNGWCREAVETYGVVGVSSVRFARISHPNRTPEEDAHLDRLEALQRDLEMSLQINSPQNFIIISGI
jgi:hypothetical protein